MSFFKRLFCKNSSPHAGPSRPIPPLCDPSLVAQIRGRLKKLPIEAEALDYRENDRGSLTCWAEQMNIDEATEFLLQQVHMKGWHIREPVGREKSLNTAYFAGEWERYFYVWRISDTEYVGCHNLYEDIS